MSEPENDFARGYRFALDAVSEEMAARSYLLRTDAGEMGELTRAVWAHAEQAVITVLRQFEDATESEERLANVRAARGDE